MSVKVKDNTVLIKFKMNNNISVVERLLLENIHSVANPLTPMAETKNLRTSVIKRVESPTRASITWLAPYAWYQERGYTSGPVMRYTTPGTQAHFAETAVRETMKKLPVFVRLGGVI